MSVNKQLVLAGGYDDIRADLKKVSNNHLVKSGVVSVSLRNLHQPDNTVDSMTSIYDVTGSENDVDQFLSEVV